MFIRLTINKPLVIEAVKNETYQKGQVDKAPAAVQASTSAGTINLAYHEQAGDEQYHERIIERSIASNLADFKTIIADYLTATGQTSADNITYTADGDNIILTLSVNDRFNTSLTDALAKLASEYVINASLMDWYRPIDDKKTALYNTFLERNITAIHRCFNKTAPAAPTVPYTSSLQVVGSAIDIAPGEECTVTYELSAGAIDDIEACVENRFVCTIGRSANGFTVKGSHFGHTWIKLYSRHNELLSQTIHVFVRDQS